MNMQEYNPQKIEQKWQKFWDKKEMYQAQDGSKKPKLYLLVEFPYPSGEGLHVGHCRPYTALDVVARKKRLEGYNVLFPMGWDAFGLPTENYAIKTGIHPAKATEQNVANFKRQQKMLGLSFDWSREINTTDPNYYRWTQWIFLKLFENGLAYKAKMPINWCPACKIGLANEEVVDGRCERCGAKVTQKEKEQWLLKITKYADRLIDDLVLVDFPERVKALQKDWVGRSEGLEEEWQVEGMDLKLKTFTTWPHTTWGATFMVIAPEHPIIEKLAKGTEYEKGAKEFCRKVIEDKIKDPLNVEKHKEGFFLGRYVINHLSGRRMPLYIANFAVYHYGTGIVKCTPAHDQRDFEFAKKYGLDLVPVICPRGGESLDAQTMEEAYTGEGTMMNAEQFNGMSTEQARKAIGDYTVKRGNGRWTVNYKLRDWIFSRQRYWGEPIPLVLCKKCALRDPSGQGWVAVPEKDLPVKLPDIKDFKPTDTGESPLAKVEKWVNTKCPKCGGKAKRETDVMPNWAGSNWYFMRYCDPKNDEEFASPEKLKYWMAPALRSSQGEGGQSPSEARQSVGGVDWYNGGMEHTTLHLLYSRFIYKFLWDISVVPKELGPEPYKKRTSHGLILAEGGVKMSKSKGNVLNPDDVVKQYGADTLRVYEMFMGPFEQAIAWDTKGVKGVYRFLQKIYKLKSKIKEQKSKLQIKNQNLEKLLNKTIKKVSEDIEAMKFNTAVSALMILVNEMEKEETIPAKIFEKFLLILSPFAPHLSEELWQGLGNPEGIPLGSYGASKQSIFLEKWPEYDVELIREERVTLIVQVNGKVRGKIEADRGIAETEARELALADEKVKQWLKNKEIKKVIFIKDKLLNFVI